MFTLPVGDLLKPCWRLLWPPKNIQAEKPPNLSTRWDPSYLHCHRSETAKGHVAGFRKGMCLTFWCMCSAELSKNIPTIFVFLFSAMKGPWEAFSWSSTSPSWHLCWLHSDAMCTRTDFQACRATTKCFAMGKTRICRCPCLVASVFSCPSAFWRFPHGSLSLCFHKDCVKLTWHSCEAGISCLHDFGLGLSSFQSSSWYGISCLHSYHCYQKQVHEY